MITCSGSCIITFYCLVTFHICPNGVVVIIADGIIITEIYFSDEPEKFVTFMLNYSAGLIQTGQPLSAIKFLAAMITNFDIAEIKEKSEVDAIVQAIDKKKYLILMGKVSYLLIV